MSGCMAAKVAFGESDGTDARRDRLAAAVSAHGSDPWSLTLDLTLPARPGKLASTRGSTSPSDAAGGHRCVVRPAGSHGDTARLVAFGRTGLSAASRTSFGPYGWDSPGLADQLAAAVAKSVKREDLHLLAIDPTTDAVVGYGFLWAAQQPVPELGLAVADQWHGRGLGNALLLLLEAMAMSTGRAALELTTMQHNEPAYRAYLKAGYVYLGIIRNPIGVDVTAAFRGEVVATEFCDERSMLRVLTQDPNVKAQVLREMELKREKAAEIFGAPTM